jgi:spermidine/putrescine transport system substrate-binding protein
VLSVILGVTLALTACQAAATEQPPPAEQPTAAPAEPTSAPAEPTEPAATELSVLEWAYYEVPEMWVEFGQQHPEVTPIFNFGASDPDIYAKYLAGSGEDLVHFYTPWLQFYVDEGLIQPIDTAKLTNWEKVPEGFRDSCTIDGVVYCVPWDWGFTSILYRTDMVPEGVDSWDALFDERFAGHVSMWDSGDGAVTVTSYILGYDEQNISDEQLAEMKQMWIDQRDLNLFYWTDEPELEAAITSGDVWVAYAWNGAYYRLLSAGVPVAYADPAEGRNSWIGQYAISATTENYDLALSFLDGKLGEQTANHLLVDYAYGHVVPEYYDVVTDEALIEALSLDDPGILGRTNFTVPISARDRDRFNQLWAEVKAAP